jgi:hypothetical protein
MKDNLPGNYESTCLKCAVGKWLILVPTFLSEKLWGLSLTDIKTTRIFIYNLFNDVRINSDCTAFDIWMTERNEVRSMWKEWVVANLIWSHGICWERLRKTKKATVKIVGVPDEIRDELQPNGPRILKCYSLGQLLLS